jgi:YHS domain-containing protein
MNKVHNSLVAASLAAMITSFVSNPANASEKSTLHPLRIERSAGTIILAENKTKSKKTHRTNVILKGYDPVAYFKQGKAVPGNPSIMSTYKGATYFFASPQDKADFDKSPAKFEPQFGGFCANSMAKGKRADIDPRVFRVYQGKLYVCTSSASLKEFSADLDTNISKADQNWLQIGPRNYNTQSGDFERPWPFGPESSQQ